MTLSAEEREAIRQFSGKLYKLAGIVNDGDNIVVKAYSCGLTVEQIQAVLKIMG